MSFCFKSSPSLTR